LFRIHGIDANPFCVSREPSRPSCEALRWRYCSAQAPAARQDPGLARFQQEGQQIEDREIRCIRGVLAPGDHDPASITTGRGDPGQQVTVVRNKSLAECRTNATREKEALSERERRQYHDKVQEERGRKSPMMILTGGLVERR
jgi:hypothetical protein